MLQPDTVTDLNINAAQCIREASHFGYTEYFNICANTSVTVNWGAVDWVVCLGVMAFALVLILLFTSMLVSLVRD